MKIDKNGVPYPGDGMSEKDAWDNTVANKQNGAMLLALTGGMLTLGLASLNRKHD